MENYDSNKGRQCSNRQHKALVSAVTMGDIAQIEQVLAEGANVDDVNIWDNTAPLHKAAEHRQVAAMELLIAKGANVNAVNNKNYTPLHFAAYNGHVAAIELLIAEGADAGLSEGLLHCAAQRGRFAALKLLLDAGADLNAVDCLNLTVLHWAAERGLANAIELLVAEGVDVNAVSPTGRISLMFYKGNDTYIRTLLTPKGALD